MIWFTSDWHAFHQNICIGSTRWPDTDECRPFANAEEMTTKIIDNTNELVAPNDILYILGDFCFGKSTLIKEVRARINCKRVRLVWGNHDKFLKRNRNLHVVFDKTGDIFDDNLEGQNIVMCHYPMITWNKKRYGAIHLSGHTHGKLPNSPGRMDVGVDTNNFRPYSLDDVVKTLGVVDGSQET